MSYLTDRLARKNGTAPPLPTKKEKKAIPKVSAKTAAKNKEAKEVGSGKAASKLELDKWFDDIRLKHFNGVGGKGICMECGAGISMAYSRHATAHLLPKKLFKSVATHPDNYMIYGAGCGCHVKTDRIDKFITMKTWPEAARRIKILIPLLPTDELRLISNQLLNALDNTP